MTQALTSFITGHEITMKTVFVPFSQSRNKSDKSPSLNYKVTLYTGARPIITTDYSMGSGHTSIYKLTKVNDFRDSHQTRDQCIAAECETGVGRMMLRTKAKPVLPDIKSVLHSLAMDSLALDGSFDFWCSSCDYDTDSRKALAIYNEYLESALSIMRTTNQHFLLSLQTACEDY